MQVKLNANERIDALYANDIQIIQAPDVFSFSLDAVLLAHFCRPIKRARGRIVDLCAGNGAVGLFLTGKTNAHITAVELQPRLADMAQRSVQLNDLTGQIDVICADVLSVFDFVKKDSVDTVTVNPPYFKVTEKSKKNPNQHLALARHEIALTLPQVLTQMAGLLKMGGKGYMVHRPERLDEIMAVAAKERLAVKRLQFIHPKAAKDANMVLVEFIKDGRPGGVKVIPPITVYGADDEYTSEVKEILYGKQ